MPSVIHIGQRMYTKVNRNQRSEGVNLASHLNLDNAFTHTSIFRS